ncbi:MAG TPA: DinB family protein [Candidatus Limnocylindrales bacterium]|nr:DinB family protein [Candidatus Limnocylindrales bacterium]
MSIRVFYDRWPQYNRRLIEVAGSLDEEQLALRPASEHWPVWAIIAHVAGTRVYWLCTVLGEPGADTTPFVDPTGNGWEDDLASPRTAAELVGALETTYAIVDRVLDRWTPDMMADEFERFYGDQRQVHSRSSVLQRLLTHEAYHDGEVSQTLGLHGIEPIYIWRAD